MSKLTQLTLTHTDVIDGNIVTTQTEKVYAAITNKGMLQGKRLGLMDTDLYTDLFQLVAPQSSELTLKQKALQQFGKQSDDDENAQRILESLDFDKMLTTIYIAYYGINSRNNPNVYDYDTFADLYNVPYDELVTTYFGLLSELNVSGKKADKFVKGYRDKTASSKKK